MIWLACLFQVAWALSVGVKESEFKDLWDVELGATYIPWSRVPDSLRELAEGAFIDDESLPDSVRSM
jgi:RNA-binding protein 16